MAGFGIVFGVLAGSYELALLSIGAGFGAAHYLAQ